MNLKELIRLDRGMDFPIKGGTGNSIDDPIVIEKSERYNCVEVENVLLDFISEVKGIEWKLLEQRLVNHEDKRIDIMKIETKQFTGQEIITEIENYYFDITGCF